jgi:hypothetical protein
MTVNGENISGIFSNYNPGTQTYSVTFTDDYGDEEIFENLVLNRNVFSLHQYYAGLSDTQNARLQNIITTLALWNSMAFQIEEDFEVGIVPANFFRRLRNNLRTVLVVVAVVAFAAVVILAPPASIVLAGPVLTISSLTTPQLIAAGIGFAASAAAMLYDMPTGGGSGDHGTPGPGNNRRPSIRITKAGTDRTVTNNGALHYLAAPTDTAPGESMAFDIRFTDLAGRQVQDIIGDNFVLAYDPLRDAFLPLNGNPFNMQFFDLDLDAADGTIRFAVTRYSRGYVPDGRVQFVLFFRQDVSINGNNRGYVYAADSSTIEANATRGHLFIFNFTVILPQN